MECSQRLNCEGCEADGKTKHVDDRHQHDSAGYPKHVFKAIKSVLCIYFLRILKSRYCITEVVGFKWKRKVERQPFLSIFVKNTFECNRSILGCRR